MMAMMGMPKDGMYNAIKHVGNYGEIFERNLGATSGIILSVVLTILGLMAEFYILHHLDKN